MRKSNTERVDAVIQQFMRLNGIETPYNQFRLIQAWPEVMGAQIQRYTGEIFIKNQTYLIRSNPINNKGYYANLL